MVLGISLADHLSSLMEGIEKYDVAIIGGGLAGLASAIELRKKGWQVVLFEKERYPFHKVCGEYVSMESWDYLNSLGLQLESLHLPRINNFVLTSPNGKMFSTKLDLGGFGISRNLLDALLAQIAKEKQVVLMEDTKVEDVSFDLNLFTITASSQRGKIFVQADVCLSAFGKRANLDVKWKRKFLQKQDKRLDNYVAVKYHVNSNWKDDTIGLHNFRNGYCGISKVEGDKHCVCYMVRAEEFSHAGNDIKILQSSLLARNPHLEKIFSETKVADGFPVTISQINFQKKSKLENHMLMTGDAAGMITPLCGNGMSIALHTSKIAATVANSYLKGEISRSEMENKYESEWKKNFARRIQTGRILQKFFGSSKLSNAFVQIVKTFPFISRPLIRMTHGKPF
jgi:menaquinone-9 beta-reductase